MEGIKKEFSGQIDDQGVLRMNMVELKQSMKQYPNKKVVVTVEILDGGDVEIMRAWYRNYMLPKVVQAWRELGELYTIDQADYQLRIHSAVTCQVRGKEGGAATIEDLDRELMKRYLDEVTIFCSTNLNLILK